MSSVHPPGARCTGQRHPSPTQTPEGAHSPSDTSLGSGQGLVSLEAVTKPQPSGSPRELRPCRTSVRSPRGPATPHQRQQGDSTGFYRGSLQDFGTSKAVHGSTVGLCFPGREGGGNSTWWTSSSTEVAEPVSLIPGLSRGARRIPVILLTSRVASLAEG